MAISGDNGVGRSPGDFFVFYSFFWPGDDGRGSYQFFRGNLVRWRNIERKIYIKIPVIGISDKQKFDLYAIKRSKKVVQLLNYSEKKKNRNFPKSLPCLRVSMANFRFYLMAPL